MATRYGGYMGRMLDVNLTTGEVKDYEVSDRDRERFLGGKGIAAKILFDELKPGIDPLGPDNVLIINTGPMTGTFGPCTSRFNVTTKSPLTGCIASSNSGGNLGMGLKKAGFDGVVIRGAAENPVRLHISETGAELIDAGELWGLDTEAAQEKLGKLACGVIGPAGENLTLFASMISGERASGRCGVGAVMGSKKLKAVTAEGSKRVPIADPEAYKKATRDWTKTLKEHPVTGEALPRYGTAGFINRANATNVLPTRNFKYGHFENADAISGETLAETRLKKNGGCVSCPIRCSRVVEREGKLIKGPEYETIGMFGSNLMNDDMDLIIEWNQIADRMGMDTITAGGVIGFAMELAEKGLVDWDLKFGEFGGISGLLEDIAYRRGIGAELADGTRVLARKYGGEDFAINVRGLELAAYEPRSAVGHGLGYAVANRGGCHINGGYMVFFEALGPVNMDPYTPLAKPGFALFQQDAMDAVASAGNCIFTTYAVIPKEAAGIKPGGFLGSMVGQTLIASRFLMDHLGKLTPDWLPFQLSFLIPHTKVLSELLGTRITMGKFLAFGERVFNIERLFNLREGIGGESDQLPARLTDEQQRPDEPRSRVPLAEMLPVYYKVRGWDSRGIPTDKTLKRLDMEEFAAVGRG